MSCRAVLGQMLNQRTPTLLREHTPASATGGFGAAVNFLPHARTFMMIMCIKSLWLW